MNPVLADPDVKINMSLDEIIHLTKDQINSQLSWRNLKPNKRRKRNQRRGLENGEHSVPLLSSPGGVEIYVSKKSSLLGVEHRRRITEALSNRAMNLPLIKKCKEVIPAEYKLVKTNQGVERVLVPTEEYYSKPPKKKLLPLRKLNKQDSNGLDGDSFLESPPPLITSPIYSPPLQSSTCFTKMDLDSDNEITVLEGPQSGKRYEVIDLESELPVDVLEVKKLCVGAPALIPDDSIKTLSDRFTLLTGSFRL